MPQQKKITVRFPAGYALDDQQRESLKNVLNVQLAGVQQVELGEDPPPLPEINVPLRRRATKTGKKKPVANKSAKGSSKSSR